MQIRLLRLAGWERVVSLVNYSQAWVMPGKMGEYTLAQAWAAFDARFVSKQYA